MIHSGNFRNIPLIEVSVEDWSIVKHCDEKRRPITFTVNAQEKKADYKNIHNLITPQKTRMSSGKMQQNATNFIRTSHNGKKA